MYFDFVTTFLCLHTPDGQVSSPAEYWTMLVLLSQQFTVMLTQAIHLNVYDCPHCPRHRVFCFPLLLLSSFIGWGLYATAWLYAAVWASVMTCCWSFIVTVLLWYQSIAESFPFAVECCGRWSFLSTKCLRKLHAITWQCVVFSYFFSCHNSHLPNVKVPNRLYFRKE